MAELSSAADAGARSVLAKLTVPAGTAVRSGQFVRVLLVGAPSRALLVPSAALSPLGQMERIFVVGPNNRAVLRLVKSGAPRADRIEILSGLDDGERVVIGFDTTETLEFERPKLRVRVTKYLKYACPGQPQCGIAQPERIAGLVEGNRFDTSVAVEIAKAGVR